MILYLDHLPKAYNYLKEGDNLNLGDRILSVLKHQVILPGGICFLIEDKLFTGDTLFQGSIGRTDFPGGNLNAAYK